MQQRSALSDLLQQLLKQRDQREQELLQVLVRIPVSPPVMFLLFQDGCS